MGKMNKYVVTGVVAIVAVAIMMRIPQLRVYVMGS